MIYYLVIDIDPYCSLFEKYKLVDSSNYIFNQKFDVILQLVKINKKNRLVRWMSEEELKERLK